LIYWFNESGEDRKQRLTVQMNAVRVRHHDPGTGSVTASREVSRGADIEVGLAAKRAPLLSFERR
jgi:hypothetical protein